MLLHAHDALLFASTESSAVFTSFRRSFNTGFSRITSYKIFRKSFPVCVSDCNVNLNSFRHGKFVWPIRQPTVRSFWSGVSKNSSQDVSSETNVKSSIIYSSNLDIKSSDSNELQNVPKSQRTSILSSESAPALVALLSSECLAVQREIELANILIGYEQVNKVTRFL